ncbi:MAG: HD domain-containing protein, partial [Candidatus Methanomethylicia archaeon]
MFMDIVKVVEDKVIKIYLDSKGNYPSSHDLLHVKRVLNNALTIASHMHLSDREIILLKLACLLHDISIPLNGVKEDHAIHSANYASSILID